RIQIAGGGIFDIEYIPKDGQELFFDLGDLSPLAIDVVSPSDGEQLLLDAGQFIALHVLKRELIPEGKQFPINKITVLAGFILDGEVIPETEQFLLHHISHGGIPGNSSTRGLQEP